MRVRSQRGFTLLELMTAVAIVAILSALAIQNYQIMTSKSQRSNGIAMLAPLLAAQRAYFAENNGFAANYLKLGYGMDARCTPCSYYDHWHASQSGTGAGCSRAYPDAWFYASPGGSTYPPSNAPNAQTWRVVSTGNIDNDTYSDELQVGHWPGLVTMTGVKVRQNDLVNQTQSYPLQ